MLSFIYWRIAGFFSRSVLERVIAYLFVSELIVKVVFELGLGWWHFELSRQKQYFFYTFMFLDYVLNINSLVNIRLRLGCLLYFLVGLAFIVCQGVVVGFFNGNRVFEIFNDTVPLLVFIVNAIWMQSYSEISKKIDVDRLLFSCSLIIVFVCLSGFLAVSIGRPSTYSASGILVGIYVPLFFAALIGGNLKRHNLFLFFVVILFNYQDLNRTSMIFAAAAVLIYLVTVFMRRPASSSLLLVAFVGAVAVGWSLLPEDSRTYKRLVALASIDFQESKGSIGERGEEYRSIKNELRYKGDEAVYFGLGHGGLYNVKFTHRYIRDYGHAHYSWALFNLRYGALGYVYVVALFLMLAVHAVRSWSLTSSVGIFASLLCVQSLFYMGTYVSFVILLAGIQLYSGKSRAREKVRVHA